MQVLSAGMVGVSRDCDPCWQVDCGADRCDQWRKCLYVLTACLPRAPERSSLWLPLRGLEYLSLRRSLTLADGEGGIRG